MIGTLLVGFVSVYQWLPPTMPMMIALAIAVALCAMISLVFCTERRGAAFAKGLAIWVLFALPTALWALAPVRAASAELLGDRLSQSAQSAILVDESAAVRLRACVALGTQNEGTVAYEIMAGLFQTPNLSTQCAQTIAKTDPEGASRLASEFLGRWRGALRDQNKDAVCAASPQVFNMSALAGNRPALALSECAVTQPDAEISVCCADALTAHYSEPSEYTAGLGSPGNLAPPRRKRLVTALVPYAFADIDATRTPLPKFESKLLNTPPGQDWVLAFGCDSVVRGGGAGLVEALEAIASSQSCRVRADDVLSPAAWEQVCLSWAQQPDRSADLCPALEADAWRQAVVTASARVHDAIRALYASEMGRDILATGDYLAKYKLTDAARSRRFGNGLLRNKSRGDLDPRMRQFASQMAANRGALRRELQDAVADIEKKNVNRKESVQNLLDREAFKPDGSWQEIKQYVPAEMRQDYQNKIDEHRDSLEKP